MPRIYNSASEPIDYCKKHFPAEDSVTAARHQNAGDGPDGRGNCYGYDEDHPDYDDGKYTCEICNKRLGAEDN